jgi:hypothetical protein
LGVVHDAGPISQRRMFASVLRSIGLLSGHR